jgi:hypothetical protein
VLSRNYRQVAHALLTRPPLTPPRRAEPVRLECVMHAASVHPEPGSNSSFKEFYAHAAIPDRFNYFFLCLTVTISQ